MKIGSRAAMNSRLINLFSGGFIDDPIIVLFFKQDIFQAFFNVTIC